MKLSLCNEVIRELSFERQCALAAGLGYRGLELAPFTFGDDAWRMPAAKRAEIRKVCADSGLEVSGLHWLLAAPAGLSITSADRTVWQQSVDVLRASVELCAELGGGYLVHGSPAQRRVATRTTRSAPRRRGSWRPSRRRRPRWPIASSRWPGPTATSSTRWPRRPTSCAAIGNPSLRIMVDTLAASLMEPEPVADAIRRWMPTGLVAHVQFNDRNRRGPGQGDDRFAPVVQALRETGYAGWIAMEPFVYEPDGPTCAARMIGYVAGLLEPSA